MDAIKGIQVDMLTGVYVVEFKLPPEPPTNGTATSNAAAEAIEPRAEILRGRVLAYLRERGADGATDDEIQQALGLDGNTQRPRRYELERMDLVKKTERKRPTSSGRQAFVYVAAEVTR